MRIERYALKVLLHCDFVKMTNVMTLLVHRQAENVFCGISFQRYAHSFNPAPDGVGDIVRYRVQGLHMAFRFIVILIPSKLDVALKNQLPDAAQYLHYPRKGLAISERGSRS